MIRRILGGVIGARLARRAHSLGGTSGIVLGALAFPLVRRMGVPGLLVLGAGTFVARKLMEKGPAPINPAPINPQDDPAGF